MHLSGVKDNFPKLCFFSLSFIFHPALTGTLSFHVLLPERHMNPGKQRLFHFQCMVFEGLSVLQVFFFFLSEGKIGAQLGSIKVAIIYFLTTPFCPDFLHLNWIYFDKWPLLPLLATQGHWPPVSIHHEEKRGEWLKCSAVMDCDLESRRKIYNMLRKLPKL